MASIPLARIRNTESSRFLTEESSRPASPPPDVGDLFPHSLSLDEDTLAAIKSPWKRGLHALLEHPTSSPSAFLIHIVMTCLIITSAIVTVLETVPAFHSTSVRVWFGFETTLVALFTVEYICRCISWSNTWKSLAKWAFCEWPGRFGLLSSLYSCVVHREAFFGIIDLLAIFPYYIEVSLRQDTVCPFHNSLRRAGSRTATWLWFYAVKRPSVGYQPNVEIPANSLPL